MLDRRGGMFFECCRTVCLSFLLNGKAHVNEHTSKEVFGFIIIDGYLSAFRFVTQ